MLHEIVQTWLNTKAAKRLLTRLLKKQGLAPKRMITDELRSYGAARRRSPGALQRFASTCSAVRNLFVPPRSKRSSLQINLHRINAMARWNAAASVIA